MSKSLENTDSYSKQILLLIREAKNRVYVKANKELVLLYFNVGKVVSEKVNTGKWGDNTVQELADFIASKQPELTGFNRRGLYRMKQFYKTYSDAQIVSSVMTQLQIVEHKINAASKTLHKKIDKSKKVSTLLTQSQNVDIQLYEFVATLLSQIQWSSHLHIGSKYKSSYNC